jgi:YD repeat-containing protein
VAISEDGSFLRLTKFLDPTISNPDPNEPYDYVCQIEFPDGSKHIFQHPDAFNDYWALRTITNAFPANYVGFTYATIPGGATDSVRWTLTDSHGRTHYIDFEKVAYDGEQRLLVKKVQLSVNDPAGTGNQATFDFSYVQQTLGRGDYHNDTFHTTGPQGSYATVALLDKVQLPDGTSFDFTYHVGSMLDNKNGVPETMTLPTGGMIQWVWGIYQKPVASAADSEESLMNSLGVVIRQLQGRPDTNGIRPLVGAPWTYDPKPEGTAPGDGLPDCYHNPSDPSHQALCHEYTNTITDPLGNKTVNYFSVSTRNEPPWYEVEYGLPFTKYTPDGTPPPNTRWLSTKVLASDGTALRSSFVRYVNDFPPRMESRRVKYDNDGGFYVDRDSSDLAGFGLYGKVTTSGTVPGTPTRVTTTHYTTPVMVHGASLSLLPRTWIAGMYDYVTVEENGKAARSDFCFDGTTGFLKQKRTRKDGSALGSNDLVAVFVPDASGNVRWERYYGGDLLPGANRVNGERPVASVGTANGVCTAQTGTLQYEIEHVRVEPTATADGTVISKYTGVDVNIEDLTIDRRSGLVSKSRDTAGVETSYEYDWAGRLLWEKPTGRAWTKYEYLLSTALNQITVSKYDAGSLDPMPATTYRIDPLGRADRETTFLPGNTTAERNTVYNALGWRMSVSEPGHADALTSFTYDPLGRPLEVQTADGSKTNYAYLGDRQKTRTSRIRTSSTGTTDTDVQVVEDYDGLGRLTAVTEKSGPTSATATTGALVKTYYAYDLADRLVAVKMSQTAGGPVQQRLFDYDGRGFLRWESQPESGMTSYLYDGRGNLATKLQAAADSQFDLDYFYDAAERLARIEARNPRYPSVPGQSKYRPMKEFAYGTANSTTDQDLQKGKLVTATRYNYDPLSQFYDLKVSDAYHYGDTAGRKTSRTTTIRDFNDALLKSIDMATAYNTLDLPVQILYPTCLDCGYSPGNPWRANIARFYDRGLLTSMPGFVTALTYWPNGMRHDLQHANNVVDSQQVGSMARPTQISFGTYTPCVRPAIQVQPAVTTDSTGKVITMAAAGTNNRYEWRSIPATTIAAETPSIHVNPTVSTYYYAIVTNSCGTETSDSVQVLVGSCGPPSTGVIEAVKQSDGAWILTPHPHSVNTPTYQWRQQPSATVIGTAQTYRVPSLSVTTTFSFTIHDPSCGDAVSTVTISIPGVMPSTGLVATSSAPYSQVSVNWPAAASATDYTLERRSGSSGWTGVYAGSALSFLDTGVQPGQTYAYRVSVTAVGQSRSYSNVDVATTMSFPAAGSGSVASTQAAEGMLSAVNHVRAAVGWPALTWETILSPSDPVVSTGQNIVSRQLLSCRTRMNEALQALGVAVAEYEDPDLKGAAIKADHFNKVEQRAY